MSLPLTFAECARKGLIEMIPDGGRKGCLLVDPDEFQFSRARMVGSGINFLCWLMTGAGDDIPGSELCIHLAEPITGKFVIHEIRGIEIPFRSITGCRFRLIENDVAHPDVCFWFDGFRAPPRRCITSQDRDTSRAVVQWRIKGAVEPVGAKNSLQPETERAVAKSILEKIIEPLE